MRVNSFLATACILTLIGCSSGPSPVAPPARNLSSMTAPVGSVNLRTLPPAADSLDIAIVLFDQGLSDGDGSPTGAGGSGNGGTSGVRSFPTVRKAESILLPVQLSKVLDDSGAWGAVRVVHESTPAVPIVVEGEIVQADGAQLELAIRVNNSKGETLFQKHYRDEATVADYPVAADSDPFADLFRAVSNDLADLSLSIDAGTRARLRTVSMLRFAAQLSPATFADFLDESRAGIVTLRRLPAEGDPMLLRLQRLQLQNDLFVDTVDQQYSDLADQVAESYALWREYGFELQRFGDAYRASASERKSNARRGSYAAMQQVYASFRKVKIQEEDLRELVKGFTGESLETVLAVDDGVVRLSGSVDERYAEWRRILARINELETGVEGAEPPS